MNKFGLNTPSENKPTLNYTIIKTIQRRMDAYNIEIEIVNPRAVIVFIDATYWGRSFGVMLF